MPNGETTDKNLETLEGYEEPRVSRRRPLILAGCAALALICAAGAALHLTGGAQSLHGDPRKAERTQVPAGSGFAKKNTAQNIEIQLEEKAARPSSRGEEAAALAPITDPAPDMIYSGTLGDVTRLQAGAEIARASLAMKEVQAKLEELEAKGRDRKKDKASEAAETKAMKAELDRLTALLEKSPGSSAGQDLPRVLAVRGGAEGLEAVVLQGRSTWIVKKGDMLPGVGLVESVSRAKVSAAGRVLPWR